MQPVMPEGLFRESEGNGEIMEPFIRIHADESRTQFCVLSRRSYFNSRDDGNAILINQPLRYCVAHDWQICRLRNWRDAFRRAHTSQRVVQTGFLLQCAIPRCHHHAWI